MAKVEILQCKINFSIPVNRQEEYDTLIYEITNNGSYIVHDVVEKLKDNRIVGYILIEFPEDTNYVREIVDSIGILEHNQSLYV